MKKIIFILICLLSFPMISKAANNITYCTSEEEAEIRALSANVTISYVMNMVEDAPTFTITLNNLTDDMIVIDLVTAISYQNFNAKGSELTLTTPKSGLHSFAIYSYKCKTKMGERSVSLPKYNAYYKDPLCKGLESYKQCQRWSGYSASQETFEKDIAAIKEDIEKRKKVEEPKVEKTLTWYEQAVNMFIKFWWVLVLVGILISFVFYAIRKRQKKNEYDFKL